MKGQERGKCYHCDKEYHYNDLDYNNGKLVCKKCLDAFDLSLRKGMVKLMASPARLTEFDRLDLSDSPTGRENRAFLKSYVYPFRNDIKTKIK